MRILSEVIIYAVVLVLAAMFGRWLAGPIIPFQDSPAIERELAHIREMERLRALQLVPSPEQPEQPPVRTYVGISTDAIYNVETRRR